MTRTSAPIDASAYAVTTYAACGHEVPPGAQVPVTCPTCCALTDDGNGILLRVKASARALPFEPEPNEARILRNAVARIEANLADEAGPPFPATGPGDCEECDGRGAWLGQVADGADVRMSIEACGWCEGTGTRVRNRPTLEGVVVWPVEVTGVAHPSTAIAGTFKVTGEVEES